MLTKNHPEVLFTPELRRVLVRGSHQGKAYDPTKDEWPNVSCYARWCGCSHTTLLKYARGKTTCLDPDIMVTLAFLTGVFPAADTAERKARTADAEYWRKKKLSLRTKYDTMMEFLERQYNIRQRKLRESRDEARAGSTKQVTSNKVPTKKVSDKQGASSSATRKAGKQKTNQAASQAAAIPPAKVLAKAKQAKDFQQVKASKQAKQIKDAGPDHDKKVNKVKKVRKVRKIVKKVKKKTVEAKQVGKNSRPEWQVTKDARMLRIGPLTRDEREKLEAEARQRRLPEVLKTTNKGSQA